jgi:hypothetical protein
MPSNSSKTYWGVNYELPNGQHICQIVKQIMIWSSKEWNILEDLLLLPQTSQLFKMLKWKVGTWQPNFKQQNFRYDCPSDWEIPDNSVLVITSVSCCKNSRLRGRREFNSRHEWVTNKIIWNFSMRRVIRYDYFPNDEML